jgi:hypothetical protein
MHRDHLQERPWLIILRADMGAADAPGVVAHEIAHAWLGHRLGYVPEEEDAALALPQTWGCTGSGAAWPENDIGEEDRDGGAIAETWEPEFIRLWEAGASQAAIAKALALGKRLGGRPDMVALERTLWRGI